MWPWGACWLRTPGERQAGPRLGIACACAVGRSEALLQVVTAGLDAHKKPLMWPWGVCWLRTPGERQAGPPRRSDGSGLGVALAPPRKNDGSGLGIACACAFNGFKRFRRFRRLGAGKRQAWTPIRSH